jgi:hypothetical protein
MTTEEYMERKIAEAREVLAAMDNLLGSGLDRDERDQAMWRYVGQLNTIMLYAAHPKAGVLDDVEEEEDEDEDRPTAADYRETEAHHRAWDLAQRGIK